MCSAVLGVLVLCGAAQGRGRAFGDEIPEEAKPLLAQPTRILEINNIVRALAPSARTPLHWLSWACALSLALVPLSQASGAMCRLSPGGSRVCLPGPAERSPVAAVLSDDSGDSAEAQVGGEVRGARGGCARRVPQVRRAFSPRPPTCCLLVAAWGSPPGLTAGEVCGELLRYPLVSQGLALFPCALGCRFGTVSSLHLVRLRDIGRGGGAGGRGGGGGEGGGGGGGKGEEDEGEKDEGERKEVEKEEGEEGGRRRA